VKGTAAGAAPNITARVTGKDRLAWAVAEFAPALTIEDGCTVNKPRRTTSWPPRPSPA
jgi:hypothetical protein